MRIAVFSPYGNSNQVDLNSSNFIFLLANYLRLKNALFQEDLEAVDKAISSMQSKIDFVNPENLDGKGLDAWENHIDLYKDKLKEMEHVKGLEKKRSYFSHISEIMYCTIKSFGLKQGNLLPYSARWRLTTKEPTR